MTTPPLPQPQLDSAPITLDQYHEYTPEKLELLYGFYAYLGCNRGCIIEGISTLPNKCVSIMT